MKNSNCEACNGTGQTIALVFTRADGTRDPNNNPVGSTLVPCSACADVTTDTLRELLRKARGQVEELIDRQRYAGEDAYAVENEALVARIYAVLHGTCPTGCEVQHLHRDHTEMPVRRAGRPDFLLPNWLIGSEAVIFAAAEFAWDERLDRDRLHVEAGTDGSLRIVNDEEAGNG